MVGTGRPAKVNPPQEHRQYLRVSDRLKGLNLLQASGAAVNREHVSAACSPASGRRWRKKQTMHLNWCFPRTRLLLTEHLAVK